MFYGNPENGIVHYDDCRYVKKTKQDADLTMESFYTLKEARENGYRLCCHCDPVMKRFSHEEPKIRKFCVDHDMFYRLSDGELEIVTKESRWKACISKGRHLRLYHQNKCGSSYNRTQFHLQNYNITTALKLLKYISEHDDYTRNEFRQDLACKSPKGSKGYIKALKAEKEKKKKGEVKHVLNLIEALSSEHVE